MNEGMDKFHEQSMIEIKGVKKGNSNCNSNTEMFGIKSTR